MAITFLASGAQVEQAAATTIALPYPAGMSSTTQMVLFVSSNSSTSFPTLPTGFTQVFQGSSTGNTVVPSLLVAIKKATGSESGNLSVTTPNVASIGQIIAFDGVNGIVPQDVTATSIDQSTASLSTVIPSLTTTLTGAALVYAGAHVGTVTTATPPTSPGTFTETADRSTGTREGTMGYLIWTSSGATGTVTITWGVSAKSLGVLLALRPSVTTLTGAVDMTATHTGSATGTIPASGAVLTATSTLTVGGVVKRLGAVAMTTTHTVTAVGDLGYILHGFEEGTDAAAIASGANGVVVLLGTPTYATASALHGSLGMHSTGQGMVGYDNPATAASSGSVYHRVNTFSSTTKVALVRFTNAGTTALSTVSLTTGGQFVIANAAGTTLASSTASTAVSTWFRIDYQSAWNGTDETITVRLFLGTNVEGRTANETITATITHTEPFRILFGASLGTGGWDLSTDTVRVASGLSWLSPYSPSTVPGTVVHVWSGDPLSAGFVVTCKTLTCTSVRLAVSTNSGMTSPTYYAAQAPDALGYVTFITSALTANTQYWYQLADTPVGGAEALIGTASKAKTLPAVGSTTSFTAVLCSCNANDSGVSAAWDSIVAWAPTFVCHVGDFHYKSSTSLDPDVHSGLLATQIQNAAGLKAALAAVPVVYINSDHEAGTDNGDSNNAWTAAFNTAYTQVVPARLVDTLPSPVSKHRTWVVGRIRFILIDARSTDRSPGAAVDDINKTMLGATQKTWLKTQLLQSQALKVIVCDIPWMGTATGFQWQDKWQSYGTERQELADFITSNGVKVDFWHGDSHYIAVDQTHNTWGGFPNLCGSPLDNVGSSTDIAFFDSAYSTATSAGSSYMRATFTDDGTTITRVASGWDALSGTEKVAQTYTWSSVAPGTVAMTETATMTVGGVRKQLATVAMTAAHSMTATIVPVSAAPRVLQFKRNTSGGAFGRNTVLAFGEPGWDGSAIRVGTLTADPWNNLPHTIMSDELASLTTTSSSLTLSRGQRTVIANGTNITVTLPGAGGTNNAGEFHTIKNANVTALTVAAVSGAIDGTATTSLAQWVSVSFVSDGAQWLKV